MCFCTGAAAHELRTAVAEMFRGPPSFGVAYPMHDTHLLLRMSATPALDMGAHSSGGSYFVCDRGEDRSAKRYNFGCNLLLGGETQITPETVPFSDKNLAS